MRTFMIYFLSNFKIYNIVLTLFTIVHYELVCSVAQSCPILCNPMDCSLPDSSVPGISHARLLEWVAISSSRRSSGPRDWTRVSCIDRWILYHCVTWKACTLHLQELSFNWKFLTFAHHIDALIFNVKICHCEVGDSSFVHLSTHRFLYRISYTAVHHRRQRRINSLDKTSSENNGGGKWAGQGLRMWKKC